MSLVKISQAQGRVPVTVFHLQDRVNLGNFAELEKTAQEAYDNGMRDLVIDLSQQALSLTSIGIRAIVIIHKMLSTDHDKHVKIAGPTLIRELLDIAGVTQYIEVYDTVDEAVASF
jgi:anti-anti-sigma regulatory factor